MTSHVPSALLLLAALAPTAPAAAEPRPDPLDARVAVPALRYSSSLAGFRTWGDTTPMAWKDANDNAARIGGWRAYAREAQAPAAGASAPAAMGQKR